MFVLEIGSHTIVSRPESHATTSIVARNFNIAKPGMLSKCNNNKNPLNFAGIFLLHVEYIELKRTVFRKLSSVSTECNYRLILM